MYAQVAVQSCYPVRRSGAGLGYAIGRQLLGVMARMTTFERVVLILRDSLQLGARVETLRPDSPLLGGMPEFDSMAVVTVVTAIEDEMGVMVDDDELSADIFATVGALADFVDKKINS